MSDNKPPEPLYPCHFCNEEYSWPASDLHWSTRFKDWVCGECWCGNCHDDDYEPDEMGERLSDYLKDIKDKELATLRAKAKAYVEGETAACIFCPDGKFVLARINAMLAWDDLEVIKMDIKRDLRKQGYTCRKVRVCKEVENEKGKE